MGLETSNLVQTRCWSDYCCSSECDVINYSQSQHAPRRSAHWSVTADRDAHARTLMSHHL